MGRRMRLLALALAVLAVVGGARRAAALTFQIEQGYEECVEEILDDVHLKTTETTDTMASNVGFGYTVKSQNPYAYYRTSVVPLESGWVDVSVKVYEPDGKVIYEVVSKSDDLTNVQAHGAGTYRICFKNLGPAHGGSETGGPAAHVELHHFWPTHLLFQEKLHSPTGSSAPASREIAAADDVDDRMDEIQLLTNSVRLVNDEIAYQKAREERRRRTVRSNHARLLTYSGTEVLVLVTCSAAQVLLLRRMFGGARPAGHKRGSSL